MAKVVFVTMGEMNMGTGSISAALKHAGHETALVFDPSLFDEHLYFSGSSFPFNVMAKIFSQRKKVINKIAALKPDIVAIGVISDTYQWAIAIAEGVKKRIDAPIIFGGVFPTNCPETPLGTPWVDIVCMGEGEQPMVELADSLDRGKIDTSIGNLVFKTDDGQESGLVRNPVRPLQDLNELQPDDMGLFEDDIHIGNRYYIHASKGCIISCSFCSQAFYEEFNGTRDPRRRSPDLVIDELLEAKKRYDIRLIDFEDNVFYSNHAWFREFAEKYKEKINIPYICMGHPLPMNDEVARLLSESGCYRLQLGIQSMNEENRKKHLYRPETNEQIRACFDSLDKYGVKYSCDHIFGLPDENNEENLYNAAWEYSKCEQVHKVNTFFLTCYPKTPMVKKAIEWGMIKPEDEDKINQGHSNFYYDYGITTDTKLKRLFRAYAIFYRIMPALPKKARFFILEKNLVKLLAFLPKTLTMFFIDLFLTFRNSDPVSRHVMGTYLLWLRRILFDGGVRIREGEPPLKTVKILTAKAEKGSEGSGKLVASHQVTKAAP